MALVRLKSLAPLSLLMYNFRLSICEHIIGIVGIPHLEPYLKLFALNPLLASSHLLAHRSCELNSGPNLSKKIAKLQVDLTEYEYKMLFYLSSVDVT
jgi:hypothetical protein